MSVLVRDAAFDALRDALRRGCDDADTTDAVLAALGIPADATTDDVRAGLWLLGFAAQMNDCGIQWDNDGTGLSFVAGCSEPGPLFGTGARGDTPAAAVVALAAKLDEAARDGECSRCDGAGCVACDARLLPDSEVEP